MQAAPNEGKKLAQSYKDNHKGETVQTMLEQLLVPLKSLSPRSPEVSPLSSPSTEIIDSKTKISDYELQAENHTKNGEIELAIAAYQRIHPISARILVQIGRLYSDNRGDYNNALNFYTQALKLQEKTDDDTTETLTCIGRAHHERREFDLALEYHTRALKLHESMKSPNQAAIATSLIGILNAHRARHELSEALDYAQRACAIREAIVPIDEVSIASSLGTLASIYYDFGDASQALSVSMRAFEIFKRVLPPNSSETAALLNNLGAIELSLGAMTEGRQYFEQSLQIYRQILPLEHPNLAKLENNIQYVAKMQQYKETNDAQVKP
ncbi:unnamed protein product [Rotaria sp. Silwood2]|nr:unnamed protein product [Rotaria sp. Silwood2]CAF4447862.1 unnamed protein product [Rotaria sp. Silwood2]